ncbi:hypothetical protein STEG23_018515, partial [Scotinomys teguina]
GGTEFFTCNLEAKSDTEMKRAKQLSTTSKTLTSVPELPYKKGLLNPSLKLKEKCNVKPLHDKTEPMVLRSPPTGESIVRYALPIPSSKTSDLISEAEMVKKIAKHLKTVGDDLNSFLLCCSQFAVQVEEAVKEERNIGKDQSILEGDLLSDDKSVNLNIEQIANLVHKFEDLKSRLREHRGSLVSKYIDRETPRGSMKGYEGIEKQIEEAPYSVSNRMNVMIKMFHNQANMLERALQDQNLIETKYKQMETDFQILLLEKTLLESEIQKMRESEKTKSTSKEEKSRKSTKSEKKKDKDPEKKASPTREVELLQIQKEAEALKMEKKALQEQLKWALKEAEKNKTQLDYVLQQDMEMLKEEKSKTRSEGAFGRSKGEDSKYSQPMEKDAQSGGQRQDYDQISPEKSRRLVDESLEKRRSSSAGLDPSALEGFYGVSDASAFPPEIFKSFTALPLIEEHPESTLLLPKERKMWSLVSFPDLAEEMEKPKAPEQTEEKRSKALFIPAKTRDNFSLISRTQSEIENLEAIRYDNLTSDLASLVRGLEIPGESQANIQTGKNIVRSHDRVVIKTWDPAATFHDGVKPCTALMDFIIQTCTVE